MGITVGLKKKPKDSVMPMMRPIFKWILIISTIICIIMCASGVFAYIACYINLILLSRVLRAVFMFTMFSNSAMLIFSLIHRIFNTFKHSVYAITRSLYICLCILFFLGIAIIVTGGFIGYTFLYSNKSLANIAITVGITGAIPIFSVWIIISWLFLKKLFLLSIECRKMDNEPSSKRSQNSTQNSSTTQEKKKIKIETEKKQREKLVV